MARKRESATATVAVKPSDAKRLRRYRESGLIPHVIITDALNLYESREVSAGSGGSSQASAANNQAQLPATTNIARTG